MESRTAFLERRFQALQKVTGFISYISDLHKLLDLIMEESREILDSEASSLLLYDPAERLLFFEVARGDKGHRIKQIKLKLGQGIAGTCAKERRPVVVNDVAGDRRFFSGADKASSFQTRSILAVPLLSRKKKLLGVLEVLNRRNTDGFGTEDVELMNIIANQASLAIENAYLYRENMKKAHLSGVGQTMLSLSHDIKNILNGLVGGMSLVDTGMKAGDEEAATEGWGMVKRNIDRIATLILDMLNFSSKKKPLFQPVRINRFLQQAAAGYEEKVREKGGTLTYRLDENLPEVRVDWNGIERVFLNLVSNAYEALPEKDGTIGVETRLVPPGDTFELTVRDNGIGIPEENLKKMFELFFTTKGHKGTGLGLAVVKKIVKEHDGTIRVASEPGKGTTFTIVLPVNPAP